MPENEKQKNALITIRKYANRRLYNTASSRYVTLDDLSRMVREEKEFEVIDAPSGKDITHNILTQIIVEMEGKGQKLLPVRFLRRLISFYGDSLQTFVPSYLDLSMENLLRERSHLRRQMARTFGSHKLLEQVEEQIRRNLYQFEGTFAKILGPFSPQGKGREKADTIPRPGTRPEEPSAKEKSIGEHHDELQFLREQMAKMQRQLDALNAGDDKKNR